MEFIQLPSFIQSADAIADRFDQVVRDIRADIPGTIETVALNTVWCVTWAVTFATAFTFYGVQAAAEAWRTRDYAAITAQICATPDADLDELVLPVLAVELSTGADDLAALSAHQLRPLCKSRGIQWLNARGQGKHLAKAEMIAALTC